MMPQQSRDGGVFRGERSKKFLQASKVATEFQKRYYQEIQEQAAQGVPVIWGNDDDALKMHSCYAMIQEIQEKKMRAEIAYIDLRFRGQVILGMRS